MLTSPLRAYWIGPGVTPGGRQARAATAAAPAAPLRLRDVGDEAIAAPMRGLDESRRMRVVAERAPDFADADLQRPVGDESARPDRVEELPFSNQVSRARGEVLEQRQGLGCEGDRPAASNSCPRAGIDSEAVEREHEVRGHRSEGAKSSTW